MYLTTTTLTNCSVECPSPLWKLTVLQQNERGGSMCGVLLSEYGDRATAERVEPERVRSVWRSCRSALASGAPWFVDLRPCL